MTRRAPLQSGTGAAPRPAGQDESPLQPGVRRYLASLRLERQLSPHTASNYARDLASLVDYCGTQGIAGWSEIDTQHLRMFAAREHRRGLAPRSIQRRLSACRGLFRFLLSSGEMQRDPAADVQAPKARKRLPTTLDADTMARLLAFRSDTQTRSSRQGDHGTVLFVGPAPRRIDRPRPGGRRPARPYGAGARQRPQDAHRCRSASRP